jgi:stage II sporulation protein AA (anti-sigma F factor antagonist)
MDARARAALSGSEDKVIETDSLMTASLRRLPAWRDPKRPQAGDVMRFEVTRMDAASGAHQVIAARGELDVATVKQVVPAAEAAIQDGRPLCLDLSECPFIDSSGLRLVLRLHRELAGGGGAVAVVAHAKIRRLFALTAIDLSVPMFESRDEALAWLDERGGDQGNR